MISTCECANCGQKMEWDPSECEPGTETQCPTCNAAVSLGEKKDTQSGQLSAPGFEPKKKEPFNWMSLLPAFIGLCVILALVSLPSLLGSQQGMETLGVAVFFARVALCIFATALVVAWVVLPFVLISRLRKMHETIERAHDTLKEAQYDLRRIYAVEKAKDR